MRKNERAWRQKSERERVRIEKSSCSSLTLEGKKLAGQVLKQDRTGVGYLTSPYIVKLRKCTIRWTTSIPRMQKGSHGFLSGFDVLSHGVPIDLDRISPFFTSQKCTHSSAKQKTYLTISTIISYLSPIGWNTASSGMIKVFICRNAYHINDKKKRSGQLRIIKLQLLLLEYCLVKPDACVLSDVILLRHKYKFTI